MQQIGSIIDEYEYNLYLKSFEIANGEDFLQHERFALKPAELWDILSEEDIARQKRISNYFVASKLKNYQKLLLKLEKSEQRKQWRLENSTRKQNEDRSGLWSSDGQLVYGLWHNGLFSKFGRSTISKLYDRRAFAAATIDNNQRLAIDLSYVKHLNYFETRQVGINIQNVLAVNKYRCKYPYTIEFVGHDLRENAEFNEVISKQILTWSDDKAFPYVRHSTLADKIYPDSDHLYYLTPSAEIALTIEELSDPENILIMPAFSTTDLRHPILEQMNKYHFSHARRLPAHEHVVWDSFHGVLSMDIMFKIISSMRYDHKLEWKEAFHAALTGGQIKAPEVIQQIEQERSDRYARRKKYIETSQQNLNRNSKGFPNVKKIKY